MNSPFIRERVVNRDDLPEYLKQIPAYVLADPDWLRLYLDLYRLPTPAPADVAEEIDYRAFLGAYGYVEKVAR